MSIHFEQSSYREKLLEHLFVGEVLRCLWRRHVTSVELLRPEVDNGGYDLVLGCGTVTRHIQLKSSYRDSSTQTQNLNIRLADKPSGCVVWMYFHPESLELGPYLWFGGAPGVPLPDIRSFPVAKHTKANAQGVKVERPRIRTVRRSAFEQVDHVNVLVEKLFGKLDLGPNGVLESTV